MSGLGEIDRLREENARLTERLEGCHRKQAAVYTAFEGALEAATALGEENRQAAELLTWWLANEESEFRSRFGFVPGDKPASGLLPRTRAWLSRKETP